MNIENPAVSTANEDCSFSHILYDCSRVKSGKWKCSVVNYIYVTTKPNICFNNEPSIFALVTVANMKS
jgi:hypothetical protein